MKKKFSLLALLSLLLLAVMPAGTAMAAKPVSFGAVGTIATIDDGDVSAAGASTRFVVKERHITGLLDGSLLGAYTLTYGSNVPIATQSGNIHGTLSITGPTDYEATVTGSSELLAGPVGAFLPGTGIVLAVALGIEGKLTFTDGAQGHGTFEAGVWVRITPDGHIVGVLPEGLPLFGPGGPLGIDTGPSGVSISGQWHN